MSSIGSPIDTSLLQAAQAQRTASKSRDKERAATESGRRFQDLVDLKVAGTESDQAVRSIPQNDSEQADSEHNAQSHEKLPAAGDQDDEQRPSVDIQA